MDGGLSSKISRMLGTLYLFFIFPVLVLAGGAATAMLGFVIWSSVVHDNNGSSLGTIVLSLGLLGIVIVIVGCAGLGAAIIKWRRKHGIHPAPPTALRIDVPSGITILRAVVGLGAALFFGACALFMPHVEGPEGFGTLLLISMGFLAILIGSLAIQKLWHGWSRSTTLMVDRHGITMEVNTPFNIAWDQIEDMRYIRLKIALAPHPMLGLTVREPISHLPKALKVGRYKGFFTDPGTTNIALPLNGFLMEARPLFAAIQARRPTMQVSDTNTRGDTPQQGV